MIASRRPRLLPVARNCILPDMRPGQPEQVAKSQAGMGGKIDGVCDLRRTSLLELRNIGVGPNDFRAVAAVELLDSLARVARDLAERVNRVGEHAGENLHSIVSRARLVGPLIAPASNYRTNFLRPVELRDAQVAKIVRDAIQPRRPILARRFRKLLRSRCLPCRANTSDLNRPGSGVRRLSIASL